MNASNVMLMTSAFEASPVTVREALACDLAVVSTAVGDVPLLARRINGCTSVESADPESLAAAVAQALESGGAADGASVRDEYCLARTAEKIVSVYETVIEQRKASQT
jgi:glycosyltransferase involved in cell wall biosynthesis